MLVIKELDHSVSEKSLYFVFQWNILIIAADVVRTNRYVYSWYNIIYHEDEILTILQARGPNYSRQKQTAALMSFLWLWKELERAKFGAFPRYHILEDKKKQLGFGMYDTYPLVNEKAFFFCNSTQIRQVSIPTNGNVQ